MTQHRENTSNIEQDGSVAGCVQSALVERVARALCDLGRPAGTYAARDDQGRVFWQCHAKAALEASHHAEMRLALKRCQRFFVSNWSAEEAVACDQAVNTVLTKVGGDA